MNSQNNVQSLPFALRSIYFSDSSAALTPGFNPIVPDQALAGHFRMMSAEGFALSTQPESNGGELSTISFSTSFEFVYTKNLTNSPTDQLFEESDVCARVTAEIIVNYALVASSLPPQDILRVWASSAVLAQSWPYWREFCHGALARMGLPVAMMPFLNIAPPQQLGAQIEPQPGATEKKIRKTKRKAI